MSWLSKGVKALGKGLKKAAPILKYTPGLLGSGLSVADAAQKPGGIGKNLGADFLGRAKTIGPILLGGAGAGALGGAGAASSAAPAAASGGGWGATALGGLKQLGGWAMKNPDLVLGGLSLYDQYQSGKRADKAAQAALDFERQQYTDAAPLRQLGMRGLLASPPTYGTRLQAPRREDVGFSSGWSSNPFAR